MNDFSVFKAVLRRFLFFSCLTHLCASQLLEKDILRVFFLSCNGDKWVEHSNWMVDEVNFCEWNGITCSDDHQSVDKLELRNQNVSCTLPVEIFYLPNLRVLDLSGNKGVVADFRHIELSRLGSLKMIFLADGSTKTLKGIDRAFKNSLIALSVAGNLLTGTLPTEVLGLTGLQQLDLSHNFLSGTLSESLGALTDLQTFAVQHNLLSGPIPSGLSVQSKLCSLSLQFKKFSGTIPSAIGKLSSLTFLSLNDQGEGGLVGPLIDFADLPNLFTINLANNKLTGTVPSSLLLSVDSNFSPLMMVDLSGNKLSGAIPSAFTRFESIRLYLKTNEIDTISPELCNKSNWFFGEVGEFGCNAILCPPGTFSLFGRQISEGYPCESCRGSGNRHFGGTQCNFTSDRKNVKESAASTNLFETSSALESLDEMPSNRTQWRGPRSTRNGHLNNISGENMTRLRGIN